MSRKSVFSLESPFKDPVRSKLFGLAQGAFEKFLYLDEINQIYEAAVEAGNQESDFLGNVIRAVGVRYEISEGDLKKIPPEGPLVVVANHPFGGIEGILLLHLLRRVRPDVKVMANYLLARMPEMAEYSIYVDPFGTGQSAQRNVAGMKESLRWVRAGHVLAVFPSGEVSHVDLQKRAICDPPWSSTIARIVQRTEVPVLPVFFQGRNGTLFQVMGLIHPRFRTAMLPYELVRKRNRVFQVNTGRPIPWKRLSSFDTDALTGYLRFRTYLLCNRQYRGRAVKPRLFVRRDAVRHPVEEAGDAALLGAEFHALPSDGFLVRTPEFTVFLAEAGQIPTILREIGRLRESTFRAAGEGTGQPTDLDRFDQWYEHLVLWDNARGVPAGAYRLARTDRTVREQGLDGLYTRTLFRYRAQLLEKMGPSIELGRSFIGVEYQKSYAPLMLLWKGLAQVVCNRPEYKSLFGPVSINNDYHSASRQLMAAFLKMNSFLPDAGALVKARNPFRSSPMRNLDPHTFSQTVTDVEQVSELIADIESEQKGVPVLLRQYLKLGGRLLGFNIDPNFSEVLDGLIWVDLTQTHPKILERFMGKANAEAFLAHHTRQARQDGIDQAG